MQPTFPNIPAGMRLVLESRKKRIVISKRADAPYDWQMQMYEWGWFSWIKIATLLFRPRAETPPEGMLVDTSLTYLIERAQMLLREGR